MNPTGRVERPSPTINKNTQNYMKVTAIAPSNIAFIKYWGKKDEVLRLPANGSVSVNLSNIWTKTTVEFGKNLSEDEVIINNEKNSKKAARVIKHLDIIRNLAKISLKAKVETQNSSLTASGLASSASGFAALSLAGSRAAGLNLSEKELSILSRQGSGSACRSIPDGFVEWLDGNKSEDSYAVSIFPPDYFEIAVIVVLVKSQTEKEVSSTSGQERTSLNPFFPVRIQHIKKKISCLKDLIKAKEFSKFGEIVESEALELHAIALTSLPPIIYWQPETIAIMHRVHELRKNGLLVYFTIDAGPNIHLIVEKANTDRLIAEIKKHFPDNQYIVNYPSQGARIVKDHLF